MRVLEVMKRQLHIRLRHAKSSKEAITFGILVQGLSVSLLRMTMDLDKGVYVYHDQTPFTLPTTYETHTHMDTSLELIYSFKQSIVDSLAKPEDSNNNVIWDLYKDRVRPTVSSFTPIYPEKKD